MMSRLGGRSDADGWVDVHGAAELLGCSVPTVERLTRSGECRRRNLAGFDVIVD